MAERSLSKRQTSRKRSLHNHLPETSANGISVLSKNSSMLLVVFAVGEALLIMVVAIIGTQLAYAMITRTLIEAGIQKRGEHNDLVDAFSYVAAHVMMLFLAVRSLAKRLGMRESKELLDAWKVFQPYLSFSSRRLLLFYVFGFIGMIVAQYALGPWLYTFDNYMVEQLDTVASGQTVQRFSIARALDMLVIAPFREEIVFRGLTMTVLLHRLANHHTSTQKKCAIINAALFGSVHVFNLLSLQRYSFEYCALQVMMGTIIGLLYSLLFLNGLHLSETILMHMANNVVSSFLPLHLHMTSWFWAYLLLTLGFFLHLCHREWILLDAAQICYFPALFEADTSISSGNSRSIYTT